MLHKSIEFMDTALNIDVDDNNLYLLGNVFNLFKSHFDFYEQSHEKAVATISFQHIDSFRENSFGLDTCVYDDIVMRTSSMPRFRLSSRHYSLGALELYDCRDSRTIIIFNKAKKAIDIYASEESDIQIIELIRDLIIKNQESRGTMILHAAAAAKDGKAVVIIGGKGAGKSTTLLELILRHGYKMVSGDKLFLRLDQQGGVDIIGWPDYPHLGVGTIQKHEHLRYIAEKYYCDDIDAMDKSSKILINPEIFANESGVMFEKGQYKLEKIIFPSFADIEETSFVKLQEPSSEKVTSQLEFKWDFPQARWHSYIVPDYADREQNVWKLKAAVNVCDYYSFAGKLKFQDAFLKELEK